MPSTVSALVPTKPEPSLVARLLALLARRPRWAAVVLLFAALCLRNRLTAVGSYPRVSSSVPRFPGSVPILGALPWALRNYHRIHDAILEGNKALGFRTSVFSTPFTPPRFVITDPRNVEFILKTNFPNIIKGPFIKVRFQELLGDGIFNSDGEHWRLQRKTASHIFTTRAFRLFVETIFADEMKLLVARLDEAAAAGTTVDMHSLLNAFTLDSFGTIGFGVQLNSLGGKATPFAAAFDRMQYVTSFRINMATWRIKEMFDRKYAAQIASDMRLIREFAKTIIDQRRAEAAEKRETRSDLLTLLMSASADDSGRKYTDDELRDHVLNMVIAGRDTTAQALSWTLYYLSLHPEARKKLMAEIDATLGDATYPTYEQVKGMKYANAVFSEALRLSPSVSKNMKMAVEDCVLPDGTPVPAGAQLGWFTYSMSRNPAVWGADAEAFRPERWIEERIRTQYENPVFNAGPRICLGKAFAELEGVFVLASLFRQFDVVAVDPKSVTYTTSMTLPMKSGIECRISKRTGAAAI
ncbi:hypothetical protein HK105_200181 [Polyrhizophydium stewartii]|uniref:Cytochrome P450 n=1 Tax=Polyrhizophydium stewartii TaxID=2732419 RepID=A0ABR4NKW3_9FUNG